MNPYIAEILSQIAFLRAALDWYSITALEAIRLTNFDPIILSGMGSSPRISDLTPCSTS